MELTTVGINGFGTIGRRVARAITRQPDMELAGVAKRTSGPTARQATDALNTSLTLIEEPDDVRPLVHESDVVVDGTPSGVGETYAPLYDELGTPAVFQGGEAAAVADASFNAYALRDGRVDPAADSYRVVSCNTTGLARVLTVLDTQASSIDHVDATLVRRAGDPGEVDRGPVNDVIPDPVTIPSHHAPDLETVLPSVDVTTTAVKVPVTQMHLHSVTVTFETESEAAIINSVFREHDRIGVIDDKELTSGGALREFAYEAGRPHGSLYENCLWADSISLADSRRLSFMQGIHQRSDTVPETIDAVRLLATDISVEASIERTDDALNIGSVF